MSKVILNIGHGGKTKDPGACAFGLEEHAWNKDFVENVLQPKLKEKGIEYVTVIQDTFPLLFSKINRVASSKDIILSFHLNSADETAHGSEFLYYQRSEKSKRLASILDKHVVESVGLRDRGIKPKTLADRGGSLLVRTISPCVILEPAFISNKNDIDTLTEKKEAYADAIIKSIEEYFEG